MVTRSQGERASGGAIIVDDRDTQLYKSICARHPETPASCARLGVGDVHILRDTRTVFVLERKTRRDLRASLVDGRFHRQRHNMVESFGAAHVGYVIEGGTDWSERESSAEVALIARDGIPVFWSRGLDDTADLVARLARSELRPRNAPPSAENAVRTAKATTADATASLAAMLRCVDGVSARRASRIAAMFGDMSALVYAAANDGRGEVVARIANSRVDGAGTRRLGEALAERVLTCLGPCPGAHTGGGGCT